MRRSKTTGPKLSRRTLLQGCAVSAIGLAAAPSSAQLGFDPLDLWRQLRDRKIASRNSSKAVRLRNTLEGRSATLRLVTGGGPGIALMIQLGDGPKFHAHTVIVKDGLGASFAVEPLPPSQTMTSSGEWIVATLQTRHVDLLCAAETAKVTIRGWDETIESDLGTKELGRLGAFCERLKSAGSSQP